MYIDIYIDCVLKTTGKRPTKGLEGPLGSLVAGISSHCGDHRAHST